MTTAISAPALADAVVALRAAGCVFAEDEAEVLGSAATDDAVLARLVRRRAGGEPLEQVVGYADFCGVRVRLRPGVFVPRVRSELMVRLAAARADETARARGDGVVVVVDLCCGSGALGLAVAARNPGTLLFAADVDPVAVDCARDNLGDVPQEAADLGATLVRADRAAAGGTAADQNAAARAATHSEEAGGAATNPEAADRTSTDQEAAHRAATDQEAADRAAGGRAAAGRLRERVFQGDLFDALPGELTGTIDVLLANVPYVATRHIPLLPAEARDHEPHTALDGGDDGLDVFRAVAAEAPRWLATGGLLLSEITEAQIDAASAAVRAAGLIVEVAYDEELEATVVIGRR